jgi:hypothetical protein
VVVAPQQQAAAWAVGVGPMLLRVGLLVLLVVV